jgi:hypothetical protein
MRCAVALASPLHPLGWSAPQPPRPLRLCVGRGTRGRRCLLDSLGGRFVGLLASRRDEDKAEQDDERNQSNTGPYSQSIGLANWAAARALLWRRHGLRGTFTNGHDLLSLA